MKSSKFRFSRLVALDANVPYLIIYSAYNPNSLTETQNLTVKISKS